MEGIERLESEVLKMNNPSISNIFDYLKKSTYLYEKFNNEEKSMKQMYEFIYKKAEKYSKNRVAMINDNVVYLWAVAYFTKSNEELEINEDQKVTTLSTVEAIKKPENKKSKQEKELKVEKKEDKQEDDDFEENQVTLFQEGE